jgi:hypothetical protein
MGKLKKFTNGKREGSTNVSSENKGSEYVVGFNVKSLKAGLDNILDLKFL